MWQSPMCSMRSGSTHPQFEAGLLLRLMAPPRIKVAAVLYQGSLNCGLSRSQISKVLTANIFESGPTGNALARVQRVYKPTDLWDIIFCTR